MRGTGCSTRDYPSPMSWEISSMGCFIMVSWSGMKRMQRGKSWRMLTRSQLRPRSDLSLVNKPIDNTSYPLHASSTPSRLTAIDALPSHTARPPSHPPHSRHLFVCPRRRFSFPTSSVCGSLAHSLRTPPSLCLDIVPYSSRHPAMTPNIRYLPFYSSLLLLLWSPILPEPQACLTTPHHFLDLAYTLFLPQVPITRFVSLAYSLFFPSSPMPPFSIWTLPAHRYIFPAHFLLLRYTSQKYIPLLCATPFLS